MALLQKKRTSTNSTRRMSSKRLHTKTVTPFLLEVLHQLMDNCAFESFRLVGCTALSLQIGHRFSVDIDLFSTVPYDEFNIQPCLDYFVEN